MSRLRSSSRACPALAATLAVLAALSPLQGSPAEPAALPQVAGPAAAAEPAPQATEGADPNHLVKSGVVVDFSIQRLGAGAASSQPLLEGDYVEIRFRMVDATTGRPVAGVKPAAWMDIGGVIQGQHGEQRECKDKVGLYLKGIVGIRPMVDLNSYYLLVLNQDPSISVIDPVVSMTGRTSLYATVVLKRPPADWARSADAKRIYVSIPRAAEVSVVDTESFKVLTSVPAGPEPVRVALQGDGRYLWVGNDAREPGESGVTVIDTETLKTVARIATGRGHHEIAFSADDRHAFVSNRDEGSVSVVDVARLRKVRDVRTGPVPIALAFSSLSRALYVADGKEGTIAVLDGTSFEVIARIAARPGLGPLRVSQDGRWAIAVNPNENQAYVVDTSLNRLAHTIPARGKPYQVAFTRAFAYLRLLDSERVVMVNLGSLGEGRTPIVQGFDAGTGAPMLAGDLAIADSITQAALDASVFVVNPADNTVYFYMEGMNAPMGSYGAYGHAARAVAVVDRSLKEVEPGVYAGKLRIPAAGRYDVAFLIDNPRVLHCFSAEAQKNPALQQERGVLSIDYLASPSRAAVGAQVPVRFRLTDPQSHLPMPGLTDVRVIWYLAPGQLRGEAVARELGEGVYETTATLSRAGAWYFHVVVPSQKVKHTDLPFHSVVAVAAPAGSPDSKD